VFQLCHDAFTDFQPARKALRYHYLQFDDAGELEDLVDDIVAHNTQQEVDLVEEEGEVVQELLPSVSHYEALLALHTLRRYEEEH